MPSRSNRTIIIAAVIFIALAAAALVFAEPLKHWLIQLHGGGGHGGGR
jgi:hypothetical protein